MQCSPMVKQLKKQYKDEVKKLYKSEVGLECDDELLFRLHPEASTRAIISASAIWTLVTDLQFLFPASKFPIIAAA